MSQKFLFHHERGQFFSPDLIVAVFNFVLCLVFYFSASNFIYTSAGTSELKKEMDDKAHNVMYAFLYTPGGPTSWETGNLADVNFFGLSNERNVVSEEKIKKLSEFLDINSVESYESTKVKLGLSLYDIKIELKDSTGDIVFESGKLADGYLQLINYERPVLYKGDAALLKVIISYA